MGDQDEWNKLFDKSKASKVPKNFPGDANDIDLELEDVLEEVTDEIDTKGSSKLEEHSCRLSTPNTAPRYADYRYKHGIAKAQQGTGTQKNPEEKRQSNSFKKPTNQNGHFVSPVKNGVSESLNEKYNGHGGNESGEAEIPGVKSEIENRERESSLISEIEKDVGVVPSSAPVGVENTEEKDEQRSSDNSEESGLESGNETAVQENLSIDLVEVSLKWQGKPITVETAKAMRMLLFGSTSSSFDPEWTKQNISLNKPNHYALRYHKGAAEGAMAAIQSFVLKHVLFYAMPSIASPATVMAHHKKCVTLALADILWQAGNDKKALVCLPTNKDQSIMDIGLKQDGLIEKLEIFEVTEEEDLQNFIAHYFYFFEDQNQSGCILFIYSVLLTRSIKSVSEDLAEPGECLLGPCGICNQSLVNLLLVGIATPNVFNISKEKTDENGKIKIYHGIQKRSQIGFLSNEEAENPKQFSVGSMLKTPVFPIWLIFCNNHICVLFCKKRKLLSDWKLERRFDLYYYAGISRYFNLLKEDMRLSIDTIQPYYPDDYDYEFSSSLEETIRTKWQDCVINWNGSHRF